MIVTHERRSLDLIERILERLDADSSRQVEIETKFLEVQEGALDEISFDWQFNWETPGFQSTRVRVIRSLIPLGGQWFL